MELLPSSALAGKHMVLVCLLCMFCMNAFSQEEHFICYKPDAGGKSWISVRFLNDTAVSVKYRGSKESIPLKYARTVTVAGRSTIETHYDEVYNGGTTGRYTLTHSGIWDYVVYRRGKDGKIFRFTIDHDSAVKDGAYRKDPCF